ncbi:MAG: ribosomal RNA small subunit methyltransferase A [Chloroflexi bacterium]|nr:ribosomal RNA small subunit methyltransferase A [Chloroflexota bacterium]
MTADDPGRLPARLDALGIRPKHHRGQNFLVSEAILQQIVEAAQVGADDWVIEVGPGPGNLTRLLAKRAAKVIAVEVDERLLALLRRDLADQLNLCAVLGDARRLTPAELLRRAGDASGSHPYKVVANLPYYLTSAILRQFLESAPAPQLLVVTVQWEVAQRIVAQPPQMSLLGVAVQFYAEPQVVRKVPAGAFHPRPKVDSAVLRLGVRPRQEWPHGDPEAFFRIVSAGFSQRRKQLGNSLSHGLGVRSQAVLPALAAAGVLATRRAETLTLEEWSRLTDALSLPHGEGDGQPLGVG